MSDLLNQLNGGNVPALDLIFLIAFAALLPSIVVMMTSFTRTIIILSFTRNAMGVQQSPPNMVMVGIAMFLTLYIMSPVVDQINEEAYQPYLREEITQEEAVERMVVPLKQFMLRNTNIDTLDNFVRISGTSIEGGTGAGVLLQPFAGKAVGKNLPVRQHERVRAYPGRAEPENPPFTGKRQILSGWCQPGRNPASYRTGW